MTGKFITVAIRSGTSMDSPTDAFGVAEIKTPSDLENALQRAFQNCLKDLAYRDLAKAEQGLKELFSA